MSASKPPVGSSLYAGIFSSAGLSSGSTSDKPADAAPRQDGAASESGSAPTGSGSALPQGCEPHLSSTTASTPATTQTWSTALRFAPRKSNSSGNKPKARPPPGFAAASVTNVSAGSVAASSLPRNPGKAPASSVSSVHTASTVSPAAGPSKVSRSQSSPSLPVPSTTQRSPAFEPPALTLPPEEIEADRALARLAAEERGERRPQDEDEHEDGVELDDVNGFYGTDRGRKTKKKKKRKRGTSPGAVASLNMDADYDPRIPNDYSIYKDLLRTRRKMILEKEKRDAQHERGFESSDYGSEDEDEPSLAKRPFQGFAPPSTYQNPTKSSAFEDHDEKPYLSPPPRPPAQVSGASSAGYNASAQASTLQVHGSMMPQQLDAGTAQPPTATAPSQQSPMPGLLEAQRAAAAAIAAKLSAQAGASKSGSVEGSGASGSVNELESKKSAAEAIAAKLASMHKPAAPARGFVASTSASLPTEEAKHRPDPAKFAERLMEKYGYKAGEGIGAEGNKGIVHALEAAKEAESKAKRQRYQQEETRANSRAMGKIVNTNFDPRQQEERERFGEPSETVLLENVVTLDEIDDDLQKEMREECGKHGIVERVFVYPHQAKVLIFVRFSGPVGAWKAVRELDGRFFGGRAIRARYYPTIRFDHGDYLALSM